MRLRAILVTLCVLFSGSAFSQERVRVNMLNSQNFCNNLVRSLSFQTSHTLSTPERMQQAAAAAQTVVQNIRVGNIANIVPLQQLGLSADGGSERELRRFMSLRDILVGGLNTPAEFLLAFDTDELKYVPHAVSGTNILLLVKDANALTPERARLITGIAQRNRISISTIWYGPTHEEGVRAATGLAFLTGMTNGVFVDLNGPSSCLAAASSTP